MMVGEAGPVNRFKKFSEQACLAISLFFLVALFAIVLIDVVLRSMRIEFYWASEGGTILMAWLIFFTLPLVNRQRTHISTDFLVARLPGWLQSVANLAGQVLMLAYLLILAWLCFELARRNFIGDARSQGILRVPLYFVQIGVVVGLVLTIVSQVLVIFEDVSLFRQRAKGSE